MVAAVKLAQQMELCAADLLERQNALLAKTQLPTAIPSELDLAEIIACLQHDKKVKAGIVRFILPTAIANVIISDDVTTDIIQQSLT